MLTEKFWKHFLARLENAFKTFQKCNFPMRNYLKTKYKEIKQTIGTWFQNITTTTTLPKFYFNNVPQRHYLCCQLGSKTVVKLAFFHNSVFKARSGCKHSFLIKNFIPGRDALVASLLLKYLQGQKYFLLKDFNNTVLN